MLITCTADEERMTRRVRRHGDDKVEMFHLNAADWSVSEGRQSGWDSRTWIAPRSADRPPSFTACWIPFYSSTAADFVPFGSYLRGENVRCADCCLLFLKVSHVASELTGAESACEWKQRARGWVLIWTSSPPSCYISACLLPHLA